MHSLITAITILVLASVAKDHMGHVMAGWTPFVTADAKAAASD